MFTGTAVLDPQQPPPSAGSQYYEFVVDYSDTTPIDLTTFGNNNVVVTGPNNFSQTGQYLGIQSSNTDPNGLTTAAQVNYLINFPSNGLSDALNGAYTVTQVAYGGAVFGGVADMEHVGFPATTIGTFNVNLPPAPLMQLSNPVFTPGNYPVGSPVPLHVTVTNAGDATEPSFTLGVGLSANGFSDNINIVPLAGPNFSQGLAPGQSMVINVPNAVIPPGTAPGPYYLGAQINYNLATAVHNAADSFQTASPVITVTPALPPPPPPVTIGGLNSSFGSGGVVRETTGLSSTTAVAAQTDGKTIAVGEVNVLDGSHDFGVSRFNADGSVDTTFGQMTVNGTTTPGTGTVVTDFQGDDIPVAVVIQPDGKILVAGTSTAFGNPASSRFALARYNPDGSLDTTFGNGGRMLTSFARPDPAAPPGSPPPFSADVAQALLLLPNGQIVVAGHSNAGSSEDFALAQFNADGSPDMTFGNNGVVLTDFLGGADSANAIALDPRNGDLVVAGSAANPGTGATEFAVASYRPNGSLDPSFGQGGKVLTTINGQDDEAYGVAVNSQGLIAATGATFLTTGATTNAEVATVLYTPTGALSQKFGAHGIVVTNLSQPGVANQIQFNANGTILIGGGTTTSLSNFDAKNIEVALVQYNATGGLDPTFASGKPLILNLGGSASAAGPAHAPAPITGPASVGGTITSEVQQALAALAQQHAIAQQLGALVIVAAAGSQTAVAQVVSSGVNLVDAVTAALASSVMTGAKGTASVTVSNMGNLLASGNVTITLYASLDQTLDSGDTLMATMANAKLSLKATGSRAYKLKFQIPTSLSDGSYYVLAQIAPTVSATVVSTAGEVAHSGKAVAVAAPYVDLAGPPLNTPTGLKAGSTVTMPLTIKDDGNIAAGETVSVQAYAAAGTTPGSGDLSIGATTLKLKLKPGGSTTQLLHLAIPASLPAGTYYLLVLLSGAKNTKNILAGSLPLVVS